MDPDAGGAGVHSKPDLSILLLAWQHMSLIIGDVIVWVLYHPCSAGCAMSPEGVPVSEMVDGTHPSSWRLPLPPLSSTSLPEPYSLGTCGGERGFGRLPLTLSATVEVT
jgi:hypothetical protein